MAADDERDRQVTVWRAEPAAYPSDPPFGPGEAYPERLISEELSDGNSVYASVRSCFRAAGLDAARYGSEQWNPLRELISPGQTVVLKPNLVKEAHPRDPEGWRYVLTHGSVIRAVCDYVWKALDGHGRVVLADAPQTDSSFDAICGVLGLGRLAELYRSEGLDLELVDLRREEWVNTGGVIVSRRPLPGDPTGDVAFDLGGLSELADHRGSGRYYGADYNSESLNAHHAAGRHEYLLAASAVNCDVLFNLPKLKTHKKAGISAAIKNLVGVNADKNWLPHHTEGLPAGGGDEHPNPGAKHRAERWAAAHLRHLSLQYPKLGPLMLRQARRVGTPVFGDTEDVIRSGNWWGNDTLWRTCLDLNKLVFYANPDGSLRPAGPQHRKRHLVLMDGILGGEGSGPINPDPVEAGILLFGTHPASVDATAAVLMGFDPDCIPIVRQAFRCRDLPIAEWTWDQVEVLSNVESWNHRLPQIPDPETLHFRPHFGWTGRIERQPLVGSAPAR